RNWTRFGMAAGLPADLTLGVALADSGALWVATYAGVCRFDSSGVRMVTGPADSSWVRSGINLLYVDRAGRLWSGSGFGASLFDGTTWHTYPIGYVAAIAEDHRG